MSESQKSSEDWWLGECYINKSNLNETRSMYGHVNSGKILIRRNTNEVYIIDWNLSTNRDYKI